MLNDMIEAGAVPAGSSQLPPAAEAGARACAAVLSSPAGQPQDDQQVVALKHKAELYEALAAEQLGRLEQVRSGQASLLANPATFTDLKVAVRLVTPNEAGGDFYEISRLSDEQFGFLVTDVAGHDLSSPYLTGVLKGMAALCLNEIMTPVETMIMLNSGLLKILSADQYVTGCCAKFNRQSMSLDIVSAGHPPAMIQGGDGRCERMDAPGDVLGSFDRVLFEPSRVEVAGGDRLFIYTDGLIEAYRDEQGRRGRPLFGTGQLRKHLEESRTMSLDDAVSAIIDRVLNENEGKVDDDMVLLGVEF